MLSCGFPATFLLSPGSRGGLAYQPHPSLCCGLNSVELCDAEGKPALQSCTQSRRGACKVCRALNEKMRFQCGQGELAGSGGEGGFVFQQEEVFTYVREGNVSGEPGTQSGSARV